MAPGSGRMRLCLSRPDGEAVELSPKLIAVLQAAAGMVASGAGVAVLAADADLTSQKAADVLGVSRQFMVRLLDRGDIPSFKVGAHRRVKAADLAEYRARRDRDRRSTLDMLTADAEADGGYAAPATPGPSRRAARG
ncbi:MAG TPA: helix-turn-helix domain-containing protein [Phenylobacterium sp.]